MSLINYSKVRVKLLLRFFADCFSGNMSKFACKKNNELDFQYSIFLFLEIKPSETFENKIYNITTASEKINHYILMPGEIFSFWKIVGNPEKDYKKSRSIIENKLSEEKGGGLCQVSGIIYYISLLGGLEVLERYNHSMDLYTEETRFTPLGTDATVVYGYKDLRVKNNYPFPVKFQLSIKNNQLKIDLLSVEQIIKKDIYFKTETKDNYKATFVTDACGNLINESKYLVYNNL